MKQEIYRKMGYAIQAEEEQLKVQLEALQTELNHPTQFKVLNNNLLHNIDFGSGMKPFNKYKYIH